MLTFASENGQGNVIKMVLKLNDNKYIHHLLFAKDHVILAEVAENATHMFRKLIEH